MNKSCISECTEALRKLGFNYGEAVLLLHSPEEMLTSDALSNNTKNIIRAALAEKEQSEDSIDRISRKLLKIDIELLEVMFKGSFSDDVLSFVIATERAELKKSGMII